MNMRDRVSKVWLKRATRWVVAGTAALVVAAAPPEARAQDADAARLEDVLPAEHAARVRQMAMEARDAGVPPGLVIRKAVEGAAKGYPPERIVAALEGYSARLREATGLVGRDQRPEAVAAAAEALRRGVPANAIRGVAEHNRDGRSMAVPLIVLSDLTEAGVPADNALEMVNSAIDRGARGDQMLAMSAAVRRRMRQGDDWRSAIEAVRQRVERQLMRRDRLSPSRRSTDSPPVSPGSEPPHRLRDGG